MTDSIALWHAEHVNFGRLMNLLEHELDVFHQGTSPNYELMLDVMFYMTHYPDIFHHPKEDLAFARILARQADARALVDTLTQQHEELHARGETLVRSLESIVDGSVLSRDEVEGPCRAYIAGFRKHMQIEESSVLPLAARVLLPADWTEINAAIEHREDPLFGARTETRYDALLQQIGREAA